MQGQVPLIELPPLSPGIQARVMEEVEVVETVRRGWSGGTEKQIHRVSYNICFLKAIVYFWRNNIIEVSCESQFPTLYQKVDYDSVKAQRVGGRAGIVTRVFSFDRAQHQCAIGQNETLSIKRHWDGCVLTNMERKSDS